MRPATSASGISASRTRGASESAAAGGWARNPAKVTAADAASIRRRRMGILSSRRHVGWPGMGLALAGPAPGIERVIERESVPQHLVIVREDGGKTERDRKQTGGLRRQLGPARVGAANDERELAQRRFVKAISRQERVEAA